jgi:hypothetical protein
VDPSANAVLSCIIINRLAVVTVEITTKKDRRAATGLYAAPPPHFVTLSAC